MKTAHGMYSRKVTSMQMCEEREESFQTIYCGEGVSDKSMETLSSVRRSKG